LAAGNNSRFEEIAMAKQKKPTVKRKSGPTGTDKEAESRAIKQWLRMADKPRRPGAEASSRDSGIQSQPMQAVYRGKAGCEELRR
jgi:hypothetical protein